MTFPTQEELACEHVLIYYDPTIHPATDHYFHKHGYVDTLGSYHTSKQHHYHGLYTGEPFSDAHDPAEHVTMQSDPFNTLSFPDDVVIYKYDSGDEKIKRRCAG